VLNIIVPLRKRTLYGRGFYTFYSGGVFKDCNAEGLNVGLQCLKLHSTRRGLFLLAIGLGMEEEASKVLHLEHSFIWC